MKYYKILSVLIIILMANIGFSDEKAYNLDVNIMKYEPAPARPNSYIDVWLEISNQGNTEAKDIILKIEDRYPFSIDYGYEREYNLSSIPPLLSSVKKFHVKVDKNAVDGIYNLKVVYELKKEGFKVEKNLPIQIKNYESILSINEINTNGSLEIGKENQLKLILKNNANSQIKDISVTLNLDNTPIHTYKMTNKKNILTLESNQEATLLYDLMVEPDASPGVYGISFNIEYYDAEGNRVEDTQKSSLIIGEEPSILIEKANQNPIEKNKVQKIDLNIVNSGNSKIKYLKTYIDKANIRGGSLLSPESQYIGNIDSDDYETITLNILTTKENTLEIPISIEYMDELNQKHTLKNIITYNLYSTDDLENMGVKEKSKTYIYAITLFLIIAGYYGFRKIRKNKRRKD